MATLAMVLIPPGLTLLVYSSCDEEKQPVCCIRELDSLFGKNQSKRQQRVSESNNTLVALAIPVRHDVQ